MGVTCARVVPLQHGQNLCQSFAPYFQQDALLAKVRDGTTLTLCQYIFVVVSVQKISLDHRLPAPL